MANKLAEIVAATRMRVAGRKRRAAVSLLEKQAAAHSPRGFRRALIDCAWQGPAVIAELKKASPSRGLLRPDLPVAGLARTFTSAGAAALSILTEEQFFLGSLQNLCQASGASPLPCLCKDFMVEEFQLLEARANCADAVLLLVSVLRDKELRSLYRAARELHLDALCEVHDSNELERALSAGFDLIGVNSRDLRTFAVDLETPLKLAAQIPEGVVKVAESGIHGGEDIARLRAAGYQAFLIGESLMKADDPGEALRRLLSQAELVRNAPSKT
jgi:indole-3-glycerol phosphate synthase